MTTSISLTLLPEQYAICRLPPGAHIPGWSRGRFVSISRSDEELSIICPEIQVPDTIQAERGWRCLKVIGPLDFSLVGVLAALATPLALAGVSIFAISTYDTDYLLVKGDDLEKTKTALTTAGHTWQIQGGE